MRLSEAKTAIRSFMQAHYSDERLAMLLAHAQEGKLNYASCCCFIGIPNAGHSLQTTIVTSPNTAHYLEAVLLPGAKDAERGYYNLAGIDSKRRRILIPMIRAEMKRREKLRALDSVRVSSEQTENQAGHLSRGSLQVAGTCR